MNVLVEKIKRDLESAMAGSRDVQYFYIGKPEEISKASAEKGILIVQPVSTSTSSAATGLRDMQVDTVSVILAKSIQDEFYANGQKESGMQYLMRVMDNRSPDLSLSTTSVRYLVRQSMRDWGELQPEVSIAYDTNEFDGSAQGIVTATMTVNQVNLQAQLID